jgi:hypothetical protein
MLLITAQVWQQWLLILLVVITLILFSIPIAGIYFIGMISLIFSLLFAGYVAKYAYSSSVWIVEKLLFIVLLVVFVSLVVMLIADWHLDLDLYSQ